MQLQDLPFDVLAHGVVACITQPRFVGMLAQCSTRLRDAVDLGCVEMRLGRPKSLALFYEPRARLPTNLRRVHLSVEPLFARQVRGTLFASMRDLLGQPSGPAWDTGLLQRHGCYPAEGTETDVVRRIVESTLPLGLTHMCLTLPQSSHYKKLEFLRTVTYDVGLTPAVIRALPRGLTHLTLRFLDEDADDNSMGRPVVPFRFHDNDSIRIDIPGFDDECVALLPRGLTHLCVGVAAMLTDAFAASLPPGLQELDLRLNHRLTAAFTQNLPATLTALAFRFYHDYHGERLAPSCLRQLPSSVTSLYLERPPKGFAVHLPQNLRTLSIRSWIGDDEIAALPKSLVALHIDGSGGGSGGRSLTTAFSALLPPALQDLEVVFHGVVVDDDSIRNLPPSLRRLRLGSSSTSTIRLTDQCIPRLPRGLESLTLVGHTVTKAALHHFPPLLTRVSWPRHNGLVGPVLQACTDAGTMEPVEMYEMYS